MHFSLPEFEVSHRRGASLIVSHSPFFHIPSIGDDDEASCWSKQPQLHASSDTAHREPHGCGYGVRKSTSLSLLKFSLLLCLQCVKRMLTCSGSLAVAPSTLPSRQGRALGLLSHVYVPILPPRQLLQSSGKSFYPMFVFS
jgi:hypothetical protein